MDEDLRLLRAFEPVVRLTQGEFFVPALVLVVSIRDPRGR
jgi:hypothetical protein